MALPDLVAQSASLSQLTQLYQLQDIMNAYVIKNLQSVGLSPDSVVATYINPDLFKIATVYYGDPTYWYVIAAANYIKDPFYNGEISLLIPPKPSLNNGGILNPL